MRNSINFYNALDIIEFIKSKELGFRFEEHSNDILKSSLAKCQISKIRFDSASGAFIDIFYKKDSNKFYEVFIDFGDHQIKIPCKKSFIKIEFEEDEPNWTDNPEYKEDKSRYSEGWIEIIKGAPWKLDLNNPKTYKYNKVNTLAKIHFSNFFKNRN